MPRASWPVLALALLSQVSWATQVDLVREWPAGIPPGPELEAAGAVIGKIDVIPRRHLRSLDPGRRRLAVPDRQQAAHEHA